MELIKATNMRICMNMILKKFNIYGKIVIEKFPKK